MRILRSQYLKLKSNADARAGSKNNNDIGKEIPSKEKIHSTDNSELAATCTSNAAIQLGTLGDQNDNSLNLSHCSGTNVQIFFDNIDQSLKKLNVVVEFTDMSAMWLTRIYKTYENELWHKKPRLHVFGRKKWFFHCKLCDSVYKEFGTIKGHLNQHLNYYPYVCKLCCKKFTTRKPATEHLRKIHKVEREDWNNFLMS